MIKGLLVAEDVFFVGEDSSSTVLLRDREVSNIAGSGSLNNHVRPHTFSGKRRVILQFPYVDEDASLSCLDLSVM